MEKLKCVLGKSMRKVVLLDTVMSVTASVLFMVIIAADRFFVIVFPLKARRSSVAAVIITVISWTVAAIVALPHLFVWKLFKVVY